MRVQTVKCTSRTGLKTGSPPHCPGLPSHQCGGCASPVGFAAGKPGLCRRRALALSVALGGTSYAAITVTGARSRTAASPLGTSAITSLRTEDFARKAAPAQPSVGGRAPASPLTARHPPGSSPPRPARHPPGCSPASSGGRLRRSRTGRPGRGDVPHHASIRPQAAGETDRRAPAGRPRLHHARLPGLGRRS